MVPDEESADGSPESGRPFRLASAAHGLGAKGTEVLARFRDAAVAFAFAKAADTVEELFPGFREHFDNA